MKSCKHSNKINSFLKDEMSLSLKAKFKKHLQTCQICQKRLTEEQKLSHILSNISMKEVPDEISKKTLSKVLSEIRTVKQTRTKSHKLLYYRLVPAFALLFLLLLTIFHQYFFSELFQNQSHQTLVSSMSLSLPKTIVEDRVLAIADMNNRELEEMEEVLARLNSKTDKVRSESKIVQTLDINNPGSLANTFIFFNSGGN